MSRVKFRFAESSAGGADPLGSHFRAIPVTDRNGDELIVYETVERAGLFGLAAKKRLSLCTGESVERVDEGTYVVVGIGERLIRI
jgi:hypothetical protein